MAHLPQNPSELDDSWWQSYKKRLNASLDFYSMPVICLLCCCGCGIPCKDAWNAISRSPSAARHRKWTRTAQERDQESYKDLVASLASRVSTSAHPQRDSSMQSLSCLFRLPPEVRSRIWGYCVSDSFTYAPAYSHDGQSLGPRHAEYPGSWPLHAHIRPQLEPPSISDLFSRFWRPLELIRIDEPQNQRYLEPSRSIAFGDAGEGPANFVTATPRNEQDGSWTGIALLLTCRAICVEASPLLLARNTFSFTYLPHLATFRQSCMELDRWRLLRYIHLDIIIGPPLYIPGVVDRALWKALWGMFSRELLTRSHTGTPESFYERGLRELDLVVHVPMNHTVERWFTYRGQGWSTRDAFFTGLSEWADDLAMLRGLRRARLEVDAERLSEFRDHTTWPHSSAVMEFSRRLVDVQRLITRDLDT